MAKIASVSICIAQVPLDRVTSFATRTVSILARMPPQRPWTVLK